MSLRIVPVIKAKRLLALAHHPAAPKLPPMDTVLADEVIRAPRASMNRMERITLNSNQCGGRPCIRGMRIRVKDVLDLVAAGVPEKEILADYPDLEADDIKASLEYAAAQLDHPVLVASR